jgi:hypothetical protein
MEDEKLKELIRIIKIVLLILSAIVGLAVLIAYKIGTYFGNPGFRN